MLCAFQLNQLIKFLSLNNIFRFKLIYTKTQLVSLPDYKTNYYKVNAISLNSFVFTEKRKRKKHNELPLFEIQKHSMHHINMHVLRGNINYLLLPILQLYYGIQFNAEISIGRPV